MRLVRPNADADDLDFRPESNPVESPVTQSSKLRIILSSVLPLPDEKMDRKLISTALNVFFTPESLPLE